MKVVNPVTITDAMIGACNVTEADYSEWSSGSTYALGDRVMLASTHTIYESLQAGNANHDPSLATASTPTSWWAVVSATNRWKMFDQSTGSQTENGTSISIELTPMAYVNTIALLNISAASVQVVMTDPVDGEVYNQTYSLSTGLTEGDWDAYFFDYITRKSQLVLDDLPAYISATITITVNEPTGTAKVGVLKLGRAIELGAVLYGAKVGITDYSVKQTDDFGGYTLLQRAYSDRASVEIIVPREIVNAVKKLLTSFRSLPIVWIGSNEYDSLVLYGFYKDFEVTIAYPNHSLCTIEIESMT